MGAPHTEETVTAALLAMIVWAGNAHAAARSLKAEQRVDVSVPTLLRWTRETHAGRYEELREKYAEKIEAQLIGDMRQVAGLAIDAQRLAIEKAVERLEAGHDQDPSRTAGNLAMVTKTNTDKMLSLSGRPTSIREDRNLDETLRSLVAKGIIQLPDTEVQELPAGDVEQEQEEAT